MPWAPGREAMEGTACRRMDFQAIDELLHRHFSFSWNDVDAMGAHKVHALASLCRSSCDFLVLGFGDTPIWFNRTTVAHSPSSSTELAALFHVPGQEGLQTVHKWYWSAVCGMCRHVPARSSSLEAHTRGGLSLGAALCHLSYISCTGSVAALLDVLTVGQY